MKKTVKKAGSRGKKSAKIIAHDPEPTQFRVSIEFDFFPLDSGLKSNREVSKALYKLLFENTEFVDYEDLTVYVTNDTNAGWSNGDEKEG